MHMSEYDDDELPEPSDILNRLYKQLGGNGKLDLVDVVDFLHSCHSRLCYNEERILNIEQITTRRQH